LLICQPDQFVVVRGDDHDPAFCLQLRKPAYQESHGALRKAGFGLIKEQDGAAQSLADGKEQQPLLAAAEFLRILLQEAGKAKIARCSIDPLSDLICGQSHILQSKGDLQLAGGKHHLGFGITKRDAHIAIDLTEGKLAQIDGIQSDSSGQFCRDALGDDAAQSLNQAGFS